MFTNSSFVYPCRKYQQNDDPTLGCTGNGQHIPDVDDSGQDILATERLRTLVVLKNICSWKFFEASALKQHKADVPYLLT